MKLPDFWQETHRKSKSRLLTPLEMIYGFGVKYHNFIQNPVKIPIPVICVGNIVVGGAGKTPTAIAIARAFIDQGLNPHFISRGYGGNTSGPLLVDYKKHNSQAVGDEPLLLAQNAPTWVSKNKVLGALEAVKAGASMIIMDDGHQNHTIIKDLSIIVIDSGYGFGNRRLLPAGPLREKLHDGLLRADAVVIVGEDEFDSTELSKHSKLITMHSRLVINNKSIQIQNRDVVAFAGIGRPSKFFATLESIDCKLIKQYSFPDHYRYKPHEIMAMVEEAHSLSADLVTTEKDWLRLDSDARKMVKAIAVSLEWQRPDQIQSLMSQVPIPKV